MQCDKLSERLQLENKIIRGKRIRHNSLNKSRKISAKLRKMRFKSKCISHVVGKENLFLVVIFIFTFSITFLNLFGKLNFYSVLIFITVSYNL